MAGGNLAPGVLSYNETNQTLGFYAADPNTVESIDGLTAGPNGNLYVSANTLGDGAVYQFSPNSTGISMPFIPFGAPGNLRRSDSRSGLAGISTWGVWSSQLWAARRRGRSCDTTDPPGRS